MKNFDENAVRTICKALDCSENEINNIAVMKKGMTNRSYSFSVGASKYMIRIPGEGTDQLINRRKEAAVFKAIRGLGLCDDPVYFNPENGYKITKFLREARVCDDRSENDRKKCIELLRRFHQMHLSVPHTFDVFEQIEFYESLWGGIGGHQDYRVTKEEVFSLRAFIEGIDKDWCLTHIDAVCDNFLFYIPDGEEKERLQLTDWEYAGMQDPHIDLAMFCIYSSYDRAQTDHLIDLYFAEEQCSRENRAKIYCYVSACGLLWSNWCEYKRQLGVEFGDYSQRQYQYAREYYEYARKLIDGAQSND